LPRDSVYVDALTSDDEFAEAVLAQGEPDGKPQRRMADWSPTVELLTAIFDRLGELTQAVGALGGAKPRKVTRAPHPVTALARIRQRRRFDAHRALVARVLPPKPQPAE
jgi:hypothetical protein